MAAQKQFETSSEATEHMAKIEKMLFDQKLSNWATVTDDNYVTSSSLFLEQVQMAWRMFESEIYKADNS